jgi:hypothetical protein
MDSWGLWLYKEKERRKLYKRQEWRVDAKTIAADILRTKLGMLGYITNFNICIVS